METCFICFKSRYTDVVCEAGHFVCNECHSEDGMEGIKLIAHDTRHKDPILIATEMMRDPSINMHGPEHHFLVAAALLAAYKNVGGKIDFDETLFNAGLRAKEVPGGICGTWGSCGAGISTGIFISLVTGATPLSEKEWSLANQMTSVSLSSIADNGGPRCCKRNTYLAIFQAVAFIKEYNGLVMDLPEQVTCEFFKRNAQCKKAECLYYGQGDQ